MAIELISRFPRFKSFTWNDDCYNVTGSEEDEEEEDDGWEDVDEEEEEENEGGAEEITNHQQTEERESLYEEVYKKWSTNLEELILTVRDPMNSAANSFLSNSSPLLDSLLFSQYNLTHGVKLRMNFKDLSMNQLL
jgi:TATA-binding protein-associated factor Taf7